MGRFFRKPTVSRQTNPSRREPLPVILHHAIQNLLHPPASLHTDRQHPLHPLLPNPRLQHQHRHLLPDQPHRQERQLQFLLPVQIQQRIVAASAVGGAAGRGRGGRAGDEVVGHGDAGVDEGEGGRVDAGGEEGAVLREDVQVQGDGAVGVEVREEEGAVGGSERVLEFLRASAFVSVV